MDNLKLIEAVKQHKSLYDRPSNKKSALRLRNALWAKMDESMGCSPGMCRKVWNNLKLSYVRVMTKKLFGDTLAKKWKYEDEMSFLYEQVEEKCMTNESSDEGEETDYFTDSSDDSAGTKPKSTDIDDFDDVGFDEAKLIELVKAEPMLTEMYSSKKQSDAWKEIGQEMDEPAKKCRYRWGKLKSEYRRILKSKESPAARPKRWKHLSRMEFAKDLVLLDVGYTSYKRNHPTAVMEFFMSMANIVKKLPEEARSTLEADILNLIREAEVESTEYNESIEYSTGEDSSQMLVDDNNSAKETTSYEYKVEEAMFDADTKNEIEVTEQYIVQVIPEGCINSEQVEEEFVINVLPDDEDIKEPALNFEVKEESLDFKVKEEIKPEDD